MPPEVEAWTHDCNELHKLCQKSLQGVERGETAVFRNGRTTKKEPENHFPGS